MLYRKWRPRQFDDLVGQEPVRKTLQHVVEAGSPAHAYLFCGPRGTGKTSTGRILAKALNCPPGPDGLPDPLCEASYDQGRSLDLIELDAASNRGIDEIRVLRESVGYAPTQGRYKVYLIDEAHMLTDAAFNALLKTLEEPPPHVIFILATTEAHRIPQTISSRCQRFDFRRHTLANIIDRLELVGGGEGVVAEEGVYELIARQATGSLRDAENLLDQLVAYHGQRLAMADVRSGLGLVVDDRTHVVARAAIKRELTSGLAAIVAARDDGVAMRPFVRSVVQTLRSALLARTGAVAELAISDAEAGALTDLVADAALGEIVSALSALGDVDFRGDEYDSLPLEIAFAVHCTATASRASVQAAPAVQPAPARPAAPSSPRAGAAKARPGSTRPEAGGPAAGRGPGPPDRAAASASRRQPREPANRDRSDRSAPQQAPTGTGSPPPFVPPDTGPVSEELAALRARWDDIRGIAKGLDFRAAAFLNTGYPRSVEGERVEIGFRFPNHVEQLLRQGEMTGAITEAVSRVAGRPLEVVPVLWEELNRSGQATSRRSGGGHLVSEATDLGAVVVED